MYMVVIKVVVTNSKESTSVIVLLMMLMNNIREVVTQLREIVYTYVYLGSVLKYQGYPSDEASKLLYLKAILP